MNEEWFSLYLKHLIRQTRCCKQYKIFLMLDNHDLHISLEAVDLARVNGIVMLTLPPHTSHHLQPLDKSVLGPFKKAYNRTMDALKSWEDRHHPQYPVNSESCSHGVNDSCKCYICFSQHRHFPIKQGSFYRFRFCTSSNN